MEILNSYVAADRVRVATGMETKGQKRLELEIGKGKGSRHSYLTPSEAKQVAYALPADFKLGFTETRSFPHRRGASGAR